MTITKTRLSAFASNLLKEWQRLELPVSEGIVVAVSGGADSTALLLGLDELINAQKLRLKLTVAHLDHGLRDESTADARWVTRLAKSLGYDVVTAKANLKTKSAGSPTNPSGNLEQAARRARYEFLLKAATKKGSTLVLTAHTLDDQAETILLRLSASTTRGLNDFISGSNCLRTLTRAKASSWFISSTRKSICRRRQ